MFTYVFVSILRVLLCTFFTVEALGCARWNHSADPFPLHLHKTSADCSLGNRRGFSLRSRLEWLLRKQEAGGKNVTLKNFKFVMCAGCSFPAAVSADFSAGANGCGSVVAIFTSERCLRALVTVAGKSHLREKRLSDEDELDRLTFEKERLVNEILHLKIR